ncbi:hypothetical protein [Rhodanobacter sp. DHG33]|uniref:hypothetical protein n=1 Tax=Rhodanobacter sp. DHG33 TaxID=2775921 RepID=UPI00177B9592|nr:hypothetical protein [Rhodanobacter sp. DHG33]MBD8899894.1 hypothetical protein [Rhodanobacter sp. DHG33]
MVRLSTAASGRRWLIWLLAFAWLLLLACLPWWLDLPLLLACALALLWRMGPLQGRARWLRRGLRWGLPGLLLAILRAFGADPLAWLVTLLAALAGFSLLMLLENWLDRGRVREPSPSATGEWSELAMAPIGPAAAIIELQLPHWRLLEEGLIDPLGGELRWHDGALQLADGNRIDGVEPRCDFAADGRWLVLSLAAPRGLLLLDRRQDRRHRLRGWQLAGWYEGQPWLSRDMEHAPLAIAHVLGHDEAD